MPPSSQPPAEIPPDLVALKRFSKLMDEAITIPILGIRIGLDGLLGLVPGLGDAVGAIMSISTVLTALRHRVPLPVVAQMVINILLDMGLGAVPVVGDILDFLWRQNVKNVELVLTHRDASQPPRTLRSMGAGALVAVGVTVLGLVTACVAAVVGVGWLIGLVLFP